MNDIEHINRIMREADCLHSEQDVEKAIVNMAESIAGRVGNHRPLVLCVMNGGIIPAGKLLTRLDFQLEIGYIHATRYRGKTTGGELVWKAEPAQDLAGRTVILVDDILDEGLTLSALVDYCKDKGAAHVYTAVLVEKLHERKYGLEKADFVGLQVEDRYVFGYGMDYHGYLRNAAGIFAVKD